MNAFLDIFVVIIFVVCVYFGYRNGFIKTIMGVVSFVISFIMAKMFSPQLSEFIYVKYIKPTFVSKIIEDLASIIGKGVENLNLDELLTSGPKEFEKIITSYGSDHSSVQEWANNAVSTGTGNVNDFVANKLVEPLAENISYFIAFLAIFLVAMILCGILTSVINHIVKLPVLNLFNRLGGTLLGILYGIIWAYVLVFLVSLVLPYFVSRNWIESVSEVINNTIFFKWLYEHLPFDLY
jgi:uncharacterized membrane protein required for colicin V production